MTLTLDSIHMITPLAMNISLFNSTCTHMTQAVKLLHANMYIGGVRVHGCGRCTCHIHGRCACTHTCAMYTYMGDVHVCGKCIVDLYWSCFAGCPAPTVKLPMIVPDMPEQWSHGNWVFQYQFSIPYTCQHGFSGQCGSLVGLYFESSTPPKLRQLIKYKCGFHDLNGWQ